MLYLSLILIAAGISLVVSAIFFTRDVRHGINVGDRFVPNDDFQTGPDHPATTGVRGRTTGGTRPRAAHGDAGKEFVESPATSTLEDFRGEDEAAVEVVSAGQAGILDELDASFNDNNNDEVRELAASPGKGRSSGDAVLYEDASGLVDYEGGESSIDPSLEAYNNLKRVGSGAVEIASEGLIIRLGKATHRFDFYKVKDYRIGDNYIALYLKGSRAVRLFLVDGNPDLRLEIQAAVEDYFRGVS
ncbi:MAG: hypothetical protein MUC76_09805 [Spirochaetes bacterium]|jgi:hypothetical protein|nr:hypothetical protein [Spirochaetota bacterium]